MVIALILKISGIVFGLVALIAAHKLKKDKNRYISFSHEELLNLKRKNNSFINFIFILIAIPQVGVVFFIAILPDSLHYPFLGLRWFLMMVGVGLINVLFVLNKLIDARVKEIPEGGNVAAII